MCSVELLAKRKQDNPLTWFASFGVNHVGFSKGLAKGFQFSNQIRNLSPRTLEWYDSELGAFEKFFLTRYPTKNAESLYLQEIRREDVEAFVSSLQERETVFDHHKFRAPIKRKLSPVTIKSHVRSLHTFLPGQSEKSLSRQALWMMWLFRITCTISMPMCARFTAKR
jgi:hypothetical protein